MYYVYLAGALYIFMLLYILTMGLYRAVLSKRLTPDMYLYKLLVPVVFIAYIVDFLANMTVATVLFRELPREKLVTTRLIRLRKDEPDTKNGKMAAYICDKMLDIFDPTGNHC
jgi:hypothetical protein